VEEVEPLENALHLVKQKIISTLEAVGANEYNIYIKGEGNFRDEIAVTRPYKGNRDLTHRPRYEKEIRDYLINVWNAELVNGMEVDDKVAMEQWYDLYHRYPGKTTKAGADTIICSPDKDLDQIPGWHYNYNTGERYWVDEETALRNLYIQILAGDASDNIQGVPKIGHKTAIRLLEGAAREEDLYRICKEQYDKAYGEKADEIMNEMANLVYLKRSENDKWERPRKN
jgi:hypothetical protein